MSQCFIIGESADIRLTDDVPGRGHNAGWFIHKVETREAPSATSVSLRHLFAMAGWASACWTNSKTLSSVVSPHIELSRTLVRCPSTGSTGDGNFVSSGQRAAGGVRADAG
jgi:hypothetical protein